MMAALQVSDEQRNQGRRMVGVVMLLDLFLNAQANDR